MKKTAFVALLMIVVILVSATSGFAWVRGGGGGGVRHGGWNGHGGGWHGGFHGHGVVVVGPGCCWGPWWGWGWGGYYPGPYYYPQPQVVVQPAPIYTDNPQPAQPAESSYWYYCGSSKAYYPNVQNCSEAWIKVPPRSE